MPQKRFLSTFWMIQECSNSIGPPCRSKNHPPNNSTTPFPTHEKERMKGVVGRSDDHYFPQRASECIVMGFRGESRLFSNSKLWAMQDVAADSCGKARYLAENFRLRQERSNWGNILFFIPPFLQVYIGSLTAGIFFYMLFFSFLATITFLFRGERNVTRKLFL